MSGVYLSVTGRLLVNLESLNMAEAVGNITKHRRAPVVFDAGNEYKVVYVPVISGMSLAHHYQRLLAKAAHQAGLKVSSMSLQGYFLKYASDDIIKKYYPEVSDKVGKDKSPCVNEKVIVENDVVADVGGFLYIDKVVKRTSRFSFSYMMPTMDSLKAAAVQPQLHVRYTPKTEKGNQALIYVDNASALYTFTFVLEASEVSVLNVCRAMKEEPDDLGEEERKKRVKAAIDALTLMLGNVAFGAKRSRSLPHWSIQSILVTANTGIAPFIPSPGHSKHYISDTIARINVQKNIVNNMEVVAHYYTKEKLEGEPPQQSSELEVSKHDVPEEAIKAAAEWALKKLH